MSTRFDTLSDLIAWLREAGIEPDRWNGRDGVKQVEDLWEEYRNGEVAFADSPVMRVVTVVQVLIRRDDGQQLMEIAQELRNGERRYRQQLPSEKARAGEPVIAAAARCLQEELGLARSAWQLLQAGGPPKPALRHSPSYPGLPTHYTVHPVEVAIAGLPAEAFWRPPAAAAHGDPVQRHLWDWRPPAQV
jgi:hypothetical protein